MPKTLRREHIALYALLTSLTAISIDALLPGLRVIEAELPTTSLLAGPHLISLFILGMVIGELVLGPVSDAIGRKKALLIGLGIYGAGTLIAATAVTFETLVAGRILQGVGVSGPKIATRAIIRDQFQGDAMARVMSFIFTLFIVVPLIAPALGYAVIASGGWRAMFGLYGVMAGVLGLWLIARQPETLAPQDRIPIRPRVLLRNAARILANRHVSLLILATGLIFGAQLLYLSTAAPLFFDLYEVEALFPVYFAILAAAIGIASYLNGRLVMRLGMATLARAALIGLTLAGLTLLGTTGFWSGRPPLPVFMALGFGAFFTIGFLFGNLNAMAMKPLGAMAGLGAALIASGSSLVATAFTLAFERLYDGTLFYLALAYACAGVSAFGLVEIAQRAPSAPLDPAN